MAIYMLYYVANDIETFYIISQLLGINLSLYTRIIILWKNTNRYPINDLRTKS